MSVAVVGDLLPSSGKTAIASQNAPWSRKTDLVVSLLRVALLDGERLDRVQLPPEFRDLPLAWSCQPLGTMSGSWSIEATANRLMIRCPGRRLRRQVL